MEPDHLPHAVERALRAAKTPPVGPVHLAVYDRILDMGPIRAQIADGPIPDLRAGHPGQDDVEAADEGAARLQAADDLRGGRRLEERRPVGAVGRRRALRRPDRRRLPAERPLFTPAELRPVSGGRARGRPGTASSPSAYDTPDGRRRTTSRRSPAPSASWPSAPTPGICEAIPGIGHAILADERRTLESVELDPNDSARFAARRAWALQTGRRPPRRTEARALRAGPAQPGSVRPARLGEALDSTLRRAGGGLIAIEQFAVPVDVRSASTAAPT